MKLPRFLSGIVANILTITCFATLAAAQTQLQFSIETVGPVGIAPVIVSLSDGSDDIFELGTAASSALETLAETGSPGGFAPSSGGPLLGPGVGPGSPPIFAQGASATTSFTIDDSDTMLQIAAMVLPSNDWFIGNSNHFDISALVGAAAGTTMTFDFSRVYDAGTEAEDFAFSPGNGLIGVTTAGSGDPDVGTDTPGGVVSLVTGPDPFAVFANAQAGFDSTAADFTGGNVAVLTVTTIPEPSGLMWLLLPVAALWRRR